MLLYPVIAALIIAADQISKYYTRINLSDSSVSLIGDFLTLRYVENTGAAFSLFEGNKMVTVVLTAVLIVVCLILTFTEYRKGSRFLPFCLTMVWAGGIGNLIDRLSRGFVTDMISCGSFPVFNVADMFVTCGCILAVLAVLFGDKKQAPMGRHDRNF